VATTATQKGKLTMEQMAYGGENFCHLYMHQGVVQVPLFMKHWRQPDTLLGKLLKGAVAWAQMNAGTSYSIFQDLPAHLKTKW
jgi:hypothetical protein